MSEYIEREALRAKAIRLTGGDEFVFDNCFPYWQFSKSIKEAPAADVAPVVHGQWNTVDDFDGDVHYQCSACGEEWICIDGTPAENNMNYCPRCGAKMDLNGKDDNE